MTRIAIVGTGGGGLVLARELHRALGPRCGVTVFDKGLGVGGRISTRRDGGYRFDHGAASFTVRTAAFREWLAPLRAAEIVAEWRGPAVNLAGGRVLGPRHHAEPRFVGMPGMNALALCLADTLDVRCGVEVAPLEPRPGAHRLRSVAGHELVTFDLVVAAAPAHRSAALFRAAVQAAAMPTARMKPRHGLMVALDRPWGESWVAARVQDGPLRSIFVDSSKPGRATDRATLVAHTRARWSRLHEEVPAELPAPIMLHALRAVLPCDIGAPGLVKAHRWRSALVRRPLRPGPGIATGDFAAGNRIEDVCLSARELAERLRRDTP
ncbi:NAD(P)/FAD-dependent oxidoreductase [Ancylobacter terrae]|uniref:NAD(P)/FAD-dependent oxidoreductase n=1 Tax=Ancylobacter sp. sgz301288 TaxID=3342077 RepID=UPI0038586132